MEMFPFVHLIIWSTGLCTLGLLGLSLGDLYAERQRSRHRIAHQLNLDLRPAATDAGKSAGSIPEQLLKAA